jgi:hypothetical protein
MDDLGDRVQSVTEETVSAKLEQTILNHAQTSSGTTRCPSP